MARPVVLSFFGNRAPEIASGKDDIAWASLSNFIANDRPDGPLADEYVKKIDKVAQERREAAEAKKARADAEAAYMKSDDYKRAQNAAAVESCRKATSYARRLIADDDRVARISGYQNKIVREQAAMMIVRCEDVLARSSAGR